MYTHHAAIWGSPCCMVLWHHMCAPASLSSHAFMRVCLCVHSRLYSVCVSVCLCVHAGRLPRRDPSQTRLVLSRLGQGRARPPCLKSRPHSHQYSHSHTLRCQYHWCTSAAPVLGKQQHHEAWHRARALVLCCGACSRCGGFAATEPARPSGGK